MLTLPAAMARGDCHEVALVHGDGRGCSIGCSAAAPTTNSSRFPGRSRMPAQCALGRLTHGVHREHAPDPINWFQGTLDEAFSGRACAAEPRQPRH